MQIAVLCSDVDHHYLRPRCYGNQSGYRNSATAMLPSYLGSGAITGVHGT